MKTRPRMSCIFGPHSTPSPSLSERALIFVHKPARADLRARLTWMTQRASNHEFARAQRLAQLEHDHTVVHIIARLKLKKRVCELILRRS